MINALTDYDATIAALIAHDEALDPTRAALLREMFTAQRLFFHNLGQAMSDNSAAVTSLAERVQGHISGQLLDVMAAQQESSRQHAIILKRLGAQDAMLQATHERMIEIARLLRSREAVDPREREADRYE
jgi:hypothetical protein